MSTNNEPTDKKMLVFYEPLDTYLNLDPSEALSMYKDLKAQWAKDPRRVVISDALWMMHIAINLYNEEGLFTDVFPLIDTMAYTGDIYSFFGRKFDLNDYALPVSR